MNSEGQVPVGDKGGAAAPDPKAGPPTEDAAQIARQVVERHPLARGFALGVVVSVAMVVFVFQNRVDTDLEWLWMDFTAPLWQALLIAFLAGALASPLLGLGMRRSLRKRREQKAAVDKLTQKPARRTRKPGKS